MTPTIIRNARAATLGLAGLAIVALGGCAPKGAQSSGSDFENSTTQLVDRSPVTVDCPAESIQCGMTPTLTFDGGGRLWGAFELEGRAYVTYSDDRGRSFSSPVEVNPEPEAIETNGEGRPKIAIGSERMIYVSWTRKLEGMFTGEIRFSRSTDGGASFEPVRTINDDGLAIGHRFDSLFVDPGGDIYMAWVDKRDSHAARQRGEEYRGAGLYYTVSTDNGATFVANRRVAEHACECCRIGAAPGPEGGAAILWRHVFEPNIRDHALVVLKPDGVLGQIQRVSHEDWRLDACPHHGPAIVPAGTDGYHMTWFTGAQEQPRIYYGLHHLPSGRTLQIREIASGPNASHADIVLAGGHLTVAWKQGDSERTDVYAITSTDTGRTWSEPISLASTTGGSDHPFLLETNGEAFLAWLTENEQLRVLPLS